MNTQLKNYCNDFIEWREELRHREMFTTYNALYPLCAYICMIRHQEPNLEISRLCYKILCKEAGFFSMLRGNGTEVMVTLLSCESDPGACMDLTAQAYDVLRDEFSASHYLPMLAYYMATTMPPVKFAEFARTSRSLFKQINDIHPWLTSDEDTVFCGLLNATGRNHDDLINEIEEIYQMLKSDFRFAKNPLQTLAMALTLCQGEAGAKAARFRNLYMQLKEFGYKYPKGFEIVPLGILANMAIEPDRIVADFMEVEKFLDDSKGYGFWGFGTDVRYMHAVLVLSVYYHNGSEELTAAVIVSVLRKIAEQQAAAAAAAAA